MAFIILMPAERNHHDYSHVAYATMKIILVRNLPLFPKLQDFASLKIPARYQYFRLLT